MLNREESKLPSSEMMEGVMPAIVCPHCKRGSNFSLNAHTDKQTDPRMVCAIGACNLCHKEVWFELLKENMEQVRSWYPKERKRAAEETPEKVRRAFDEALLCYEVDAWNGVLAMCRRAIQEALLDLGAPTKGDLPTQLKYLVDNHKITPDLRDWADQARIGGRLAAHGTGGDEWGHPEKQWGDQADAMEVVEFCNSFFEYSYVMKARLQKRRTPASQSGTGSSAP